MLLRLAYLGIANAFAMLRLLPGGDRDKDIEILSLRHQLTVLQRQPDGQRIRFARPRTACMSGSAFTYATRRCTGSRADSAEARTPPIP
jgi:hypothetical protein